MSIEEEIAQQIREHLVGADGGADSRTIAAEVMPLVKRAQAEAWVEGVRLFDEAGEFVITNPYAESEVSGV